MKGRGPKVSCQLNCSAILLIKILSDLQSVSFCPFVSFQYNIFGIDFCQLSVKIEALFESLVS